MHATRPLRRPELDVSFLGPSTRLRGTLRFSGRMVLNGRFEGEIRGDGRLEIGQTGETEGEISTLELIHRGRSEGALRVERVLDLDRGCHHRGDVEALSVRINPLARLDGTVRMPEARPVSPPDPGRRRRRRRLVLALGILLAAGAASKALSQEPAPYLRGLMRRLDRVWDSRIAAWFSPSTEKSAGGGIARSEGRLLDEAARFREKGMLGRAAERLERAAALGGPRQDAARLRLAKILAGMGRGAEAVGHLENLLRRSPGNIEARMLLGDLHARAGRLRRAAGAYAEALRREPEDLVLRRRLARVRARLEEVRPGEKAEVPPVEDLLAAAERLSAEKRFSQAASLLRGGLANYPENPHLYFSLGQVLAGMSRTAEAIEAYRKVVHLAPDWLDAYVRLGALLEVAGRDKEAIALYEKAGALDPSNVEMFIRIALLHKARGRRNEAHHMLLKLRKKYPRSPEVLLELGQLLWESGKPEESKRAFREVLKLDPDSAAAMNRLAWFHAVERKNLEKGIELSKRSLEIEPDTPAYLDTLAELYFRSGQPVEAISRIQRAIALDPSNRYFRVQLDKFKRARK